MFCYQCEQTAKGTGCTVQGVCGKKPEVASLQDLLIYMLSGLSQVALDARKQNIINEEIGLFTIQASFSTLTNVNFDPADFLEMINKAVSLREELKSKIKESDSRDCYTFLGSHGSSFPIFIIY